MRRVHGLLLAAMVVGLEACHGSSGPGGSSALVDRDTARVRVATAAFRTLDSAVAAGYPASVPRCLSNPGEGGMGFHHMNRSLLDDTIEVERPEILLYERTAEGTYALTGVEYIVPYSVRPADAEPPRVMGLPLKRSESLQLWYLHAWVWKENPAGLFADWNPTVQCPT